MSIVSLLFFFQLCSLSIIMSSAGSNHGLWYGAFDFDLHATSTVCMKNNCCILYWGRLQKTSPYYLWIGEYPPTPLKLGQNLLNCTPVGSRINSVSPIESHDFHMSQQHLKSQACPIEQYSIQDSPQTRLHQSWPSIARNCTLVQDVKDPKGTLEFFGGPGHMKVTLSDGTNYVNFGADWSAAHEGFDLIIMCRGIHYFINSTGWFSALYPFYCSWCTLSLCTNDCTSAHVQAMSCLSINMECWAWKCKDMATFVLKYMYT